MQFGVTPRTLADINVRPTTLKNYFKPYCKLYLHFTLGCSYLKSIEWTKQPICYLRIVGRLVWLVTDTQLEEITRHVIVQLLMRYFSRGIAGLHGFSEAGLKWLSSKIQLLGWQGEMGHKYFTQVGPVLVQTTLSNLFCFFKI